MENIEVKSESLAPVVRQCWEEPAIILERPLQVSAQGGPGGAPGMPQGFLGPLGTSGPDGGCG